jgi:hypothetical protein
MLPPGITSGAPYRAHKILDFPDFLRVRGRVHLNKGGGALPARKLVPTTHTHSHLHTHSQSRPSPLDN